MFNIKDSYITPIIISYVDKYIKNVRLEDTQLSLWSGEAVFHNLSLRLDVLEEELALPFSFVSGQIHELAISVPWTKLHSEPIKVTINTIECVLKLKGDVAANFDAASSSSTGSKEAKRRAKRPEVESPPSYMQSLVNRIVSNISVQCNNLILKYVEEDMVLSLNVRSLLLQSANGQWQPAFTELSTGQLVLRKLVNLHDLTVCLDRRNASGKIEFYEEPLLYRCSLELHLSRTYASLSASKASSMRLDVRCCRMDFSVSDQQLPMLLRVLRLALALYLGELRETAGGRAAELGWEDEGREENLDQSQKDDGGGSWVGWAWNLMPSVLPSLLDEEDWESEQQSNSIAYMLQLGFFVDNLSFTFKASENISERSYYGPKKMKFHPLVVVDVQGCYMESLVAGMKAVGVTLGASQVIMRPVGDTCACGVKEVNTDTTVYLSIGEKSDNYLKGSLFDTENSNSDKSIVLSWEEHLASVTESVLLERTPGFAMDYRYMLDVADDLTPEELAELGNDLEFSNLAEQALCRLVVGPTQVFLCSGLTHRAQLIMKAASFYNYPPYSEPIPDPTLEELVPPSQENINSLENIMPLRAYQLTIFKPIIHIFLADHPPYDANRSYEKITKKVNQNISVEKQLSSLPRLSIECQCLDATHVKPMYPRRLISTVCQLSSPNEDMFTNCHRHSSVKLLGLGCHLVVKQQPMTVLVPSHIAMHWKQLVMPHLWTKTDLALIDARVYTENLTVTATKAQLLIMSQIIKTCFLSQYNLSSVYEEYCTAGSHLPYLELTLEGLSWQKVYSASTITHKILLKSARIFVLRATADQVLILSNSNEQKSNENNEPMLSVALQYSTIQNVKTLPSLILVKLQTLDVCLDPLLLDWFSFSVIQDSDVPQTSWTEAPVNITPAPKLSRRKSGSLESRSRTTTAPQESVHSLEVPYSFEQEVPVPRSKRTSSSVLELPPTEKFWWKTKLLDWYSEWCSALASIEISPCTIYIPSHSLSSLGAESIPDTFLRSQSSSNIVIVRLPSVCLTSSNFKSGINVLMAKLPITLPSSIWQADKETFPWSLTLNNLSCESVIQGRETKLLHPLSANCTVGISSKKDQNLVTSVGLYVHVDTPLLKICISYEQVEIITEILNKILHLLPEEKSLIIPVEKVCDVQPSATPPTTITATSVHQQPHSSVSDPSLSTHTEGETCETKSSSVKLTMWLQWMMGRLLFSLYADNNTTHNKLTCDVEDIMTSVDAQQVYLKIKTKVVTASIKHFCRNEEDGKWLPDQHMGIILKVNDDFVTRSTPQPSVTPASACPSPSISSTANVSTHSLLEMTFTRAQSRNVHQRWSQQVSSQMSSQDSGGTTGGLISSNTPRSITEIVMKLCPVDIILPSYVLTNFLPVFKPLLNIRRKSSVTASPVGLNNNTLPLLYIDTKDVRIFLPVLSCPDFCIVQVDTVHLAPHVQNPLSRVYVRPDIYHMAQQANILSVPGAQVEDRQYQLDVCKFAIHTGAWSEIQKFFQRQNQVSSGEPVSENPAVEWNKLALGKDSLHYSEISLFPLVHRFDVSLMVAPAIVYQQEGRADVLVCGHSAELNVTSDIEITVSTGQLQLVSCLLAEWLKLLTSVASLVAEKPCESALPILQDSGIDDQSSIGSPPIRTQIRTPKQTEFIPAEILVTASKISLILYNTQEACGDFSEKKSTKVGRRTPLDDEFPADQGYEASEESSVECVSESGFVVEPLLYVLISEPHSVFACHSIKQRMEISCFDLSIRTSNDSYMLRTSGSSKQIPKVDRFTTSILETRGGDPHPKTGIPPSLITTTWSHFLSKSGGELCLELGRPMHLHVDEYVMKSFLQIQSSLTTCVNCFQFKPPQNSTLDTTPSFLSHLGEVAYVSVSSRQILLTAKLSKPLDDEICFSISSISGSLSSRISVWKGMGAIKSQLDVQSVMLKLCHNGCHKIVLHPLSLTCDTTVSWETWLADLQFPLIQTSVNCDCITVDIHPDNIDCIANILQVLQPYCDKYNTKHNPVSNITQLPRPKQEEHYRDDLRAGAFQFLTSGGPNDHPLPYQVLFCQEPLAMAWRYPQPRTLSRVDVFPVPFITAGLSKMDNDQVECILEYWSECEAKFVTYVLFHLSECQVSRLDLPVLTDKRHVITSSLWRVLLHPHMEDEYDKTTDQRVSILPRALAACMRVDSFFSPTLVPKLQGALSIASLKVNIVSKIGNMDTKLPEPLSKFKYDGVMPTSLPLLSVAFTTNNFHLSKWFCGTTLVEFETNPECNAVDMASLTKIDIIESFRAQGKVYLAQDNKGKTVREISAMTKPVHIRLGATAGHTIATSLQLWRQAVDTKNTVNCVVPARYVICNDLQQTIKIRQCDTNEDISITSRQCHMYAWKSMCLKQNLQIALAESGWAWSKPLSIESEECEVLYFDKEAMRVGVVWQVKSLSSTQKIITLSGQLVVSNTLNENLELQLLTHKPTEDATGHVLSTQSEVLIVQGNSTSVSFLLQKGRKIALKVKFQSLSAAWSGEIPIAINASITLPWLVKVPLQEKGQFLSIWCRIFIQDMTHGSKVLAVMSPLYSVRSLLPSSLRLSISTPGLQVESSVLTEGQGKVQQLYCPGTAEHSHQVQFLFPEGEEMENTDVTSVPLSYTMLQQPSNLTFCGSSIDIDAICQELERQHEAPSAVWPYLQQKMLESNTEWVTSMHRGAQASVTYKLAEPHYSTLLLQLQPWALFVNLLHLPLQLVFQQRKYHVPSNAIIVPPNIEGTFHLSLVDSDGEGMWMSSPLQLASSEWNGSFYMPRISGVVPLNGSVHTTIVAPHNKLLLVTVSSKIIPEEGQLRVLSVHPTVLLSCLPDINLPVLGVCVPAQVKSCPIPALESSSHTQIGNNTQPFVAWQRVNSSDNAPVSALDLAFYILCHQRNGSQQWSCPLLVPLPGAVEGCTSRQSFSLGNQALVLTTHFRSGQVHAVVSHDPQPQLCILNNCHFPLVCAQARQGSGRGGNGGLAADESEHFTWHCSVAPGKETYYTMPSIQHNFPELQMTPIVVSLLLAVASPHGGHVVWSEPVNCHVNSEQFVSLGSQGDVSIRMTSKFGGVTQVMVECVSRIEISAKEIRARLQPSSQQWQQQIQQQEQQLQYQHRTDSPDACRQQETQLGGSHAQEVGKATNPPEQTAEQTSSLFLALYIASTQVTLVSDSSTRSSELMLLSLDHTCLTVRPTNNKPVLHQEVVLSIADIQLDNLTFHQGGFDFPVILTRQDQVQHSSPRNIISLEQVMEKIRSNAMLNVHVTQELFRNVEPTIMSLTIAIKPVNIYLEDTLLMQCNKILQRFSPSQLIFIPVKEATPNSSYHLPLDVKWEAQQTASPIQMQSLLIEPVSVMVSLHTSLKVFIALDSSPLHFSAFERHRVCTTSYRLGHALTRHYLSGALFRAGWLVGSLELLGNPSGFALTVGSGLRDFVCLPYLGILQGPWGFLAGVTHGSASLMKHLTAGTLSSITNLASSVARNLDRCSLDREHVERAEEARRKRPQGVGQGMLQGFSSFGISLLGAVSGIAHHPLQALVNQDSSSSPLTGLMTGVGLGLVGVITKPLSGAAELVALTGQGLLHGTGWSSLPKTRRLPVTECCTSRPASLLHFSWKLLPPSDSPLLLVIEASAVNPDGKFDAVALVISPQLLTVVAADTDQVRTSIPVGQIQAYKSPSDLTLICLSTNQFNSFTEMSENPNSRVEDYLRLSSLSQSECHSDSADMNPGGDTKSCSHVGLAGVLHVHVNPAWRQHLLNILQLTQRHAQGRGFPNL